MDNIGLISDLHLGNNKDNPVFHDISLKYAKWIKEQLIEARVDTLIIAGDFFHSRTSISLLTLDVGHKFLDILEDFTIYISVGNHDAYFLNSSEVSSLSVFKTRKNVHIIDEVTTVDNITLCPWGTTIEQLPNHSDIIIGHWDVQSFEMAKGKISTHGIRAAELMKHCFCAFSGHYHKPQERLYDTRPFRFLGSTFQLNWGESGNDNYIHILNTKSFDVKKIRNNVSPRFEYIRNTSDFNKIEGNFVAVQIKDNKAGAELVLRVESLSPLGIKTQIQEEENFTLTTDVKEFKVVDIELVINEFVLNLENFSEEQKAEILNLSVQLYKKYT